MKRTRLRLMSAKRRAALSARVRVGVQIPATCELCDLLDGVASYGEFVMLAADWQFRQIDPHHVWTPPRWDEPGNVVAACRVCHDWNHQAWQRAGRMLATEALIRAGRFDRELSRERWGRDVIAAIEVDWQTGMFASDAVLDAMATVLLGRF